MLRGQFAVFAVERCHLGGQGPGIPAIVDHVVCVIDRSPDKAAALTAEGLTLHALLTRAQLDEAEARRTP